MENVSLEQWRKTSSDQSLGLSHQQIYQKAENLLMEKSLHGDLLDIGAGQGVFLKQLMQQKAFSSFCGCDLMEKPKAWDGGAWVTADLNVKIPLENESSNIITSLEVIEHIENPRHLAREVYRLLKPGGHWLLSTPNNESWRAIISYILRGHFVAFTGNSYPAHIVALNRLDIQRILKESGFTDISFFYSGRGCVPAMTALTWQGLSFGWLKGLRYSDNLFCLARKN